MDPNAIPAAAPAAPPAPAVAAPPPPAPPPVVAPPAFAAGEEFKAMTAAQFAARLSAERESGMRALLKDLGVESPDVVKASLAKAREAELAQMTELQKLQALAESLKPQAARAATLEARIKAVLAAEEGAVPEAKRSLLDLAPTEPDARLEWLAKAKAAGLFKTDAPAAPLAPAEPTTPANTRAGGTAPAPNAPTAAKRPRDMTQAEYAAFLAQRNAQRTGQ